MLRRFVAAFFAIFVLASPALAQPEPRLEPERNADGDLVFYRRMSDWEKRKVLAKKGLFVTPGSGETFVSTSREYVDQLGARHAKDYVNLVVIEVEAAVMSVLEKLGLRSPGSALARAYPNMPPMERDRPDAVHFKAEMDVLNLGLRTGSIERFNEYVKSVRVDPSARLTVARDARSFKRRTAGVTEVLTTRLREAGDRDRKRAR